MRTALYAIAVVVLVTVSVSRADAHGRGHRGYPVFSNADTRVIRQYYAPQYRTQYRGLPPGLQKKYYRTGTLPWGWQRRMQPMPVTVERQMVALPRGYRRGIIDDNAVIYAPLTGVVMDALGF